MWEMKVWSFEIIEKNEYSLIPISFSLNLTLKQDSELSISSIKTSKQGK